MRKLFLVLVVLVMSVVLLIGCSTVPPIDMTSPVITLIGESVVNLNIGDDYVDAGATAFDNVDGNITANIIVGGDIVDTGKAGTYIPAYNVSDTAGNAAREVTRTVNVGVSAEILELIKEHALWGGDHVRRWPDSDAEILVYDATSYDKTKGILDELNEIIDGPVIFYLTSNKSDANIVIFGETSGDTCLSVLFPDKPMYEIYFVGVNIDINCKDVEKYYRMGLLQATNIIFAKPSDILPGFSEEVKTVLYWLYRLEPGYQL